VGQIAFAASLQGNAVTPENDTGVWAGPPEALQLVAREGDQAPGLAPGIVFAGLQSGPMGVAARAVLAPQGHVAFSANVRGPGVDYLNRSSIWSTASGELSLVARAGDVPPGGDGEHVYGLFYDPHFNSAGRIAFAATLGTAGDLIDGWGVWAEDQYGVIRSIAQTGDVIEVGPGDFRTIESVAFAGQGLRSMSYFPRGSGFNDCGQVAFSASFTDGSHGVFVSDLVAVPEPASAWLIMIWAAISRRRRATAPSFARVRGRAETDCVTLSRWGA
jgi:hypothetical protein